MGYYSFRGYRITGARSSSELPPAPWMQSGVPPLPRQAARHTALSRRPVMVASQPPGGPCQGLGPRSAT
eukprot:5704243-Pyramimonas_sp.AAC.1